MRKLALGFSGALAVLVLTGIGQGRALAQDRSNLDDALKRIVPILNASAKVGRINYHASLCTVELFAPNPIPFPNLQVRAAPADSSVVSSIQKIFRGNRGITIAERPNGIIRMSLGRVPDLILRTRISHLTFGSDEQFNALPAIDGALSTKEVQAAMKRSGFQMAARPYMYLLQQPVQGRPHLPPSMANVTLDQVLDLIATTFDGIVLYGACEQPRVFDIDFRIIAGSEYLVPSAASPK